MLFLMVTHKYLPIYQQYFKYSISKCSGKAYSNFRMREKHSIHPRHLTTWLVPKFECPSPKDACGSSISATGFQSHSFAFKNTSYYTVPQTGTQSLSWLISVQVGFQRQNLHIQINPKFPNKGLKTRLPGHDSLNQIFRSRKLLKTWNFPG